MRRFIYKKVTTALPVLSHAYIQGIVQPQTRLIRSWRRAGYFVLGQPPAAAAETITIDKWLPSIPFHRPRRATRSKDAFYPDQLYTLAAAPAAPSLSSWFVPVVQPRSPLTRLSPALLSSGNVSGFVPPSATVGDAFYKLKLFSESRITDL